MTKTDNHNLPAKLALRRSMLKAFNPPDGLSVCDCFSGGEVLWSTLRKEFPVRDYLALDLKPKANRLKLDSLRYLENQTWNHNVIDLDAYGSPWSHWLEVLKRGLSGLVFITIGNSVMNRQSNAALCSAGITFKVPIGLQSGLKELLADLLLGRALKTFRVTSALEAENPGGSARYIGIELQRKDFSKSRQ